MYGGDNTTDSNSSDDNNGKFQALPVGALPSNFDPNKAPATAEEYLHQVMWEAKQYKDVVTVKLDKNKIKKQPVVVRPGMKAQAPADYLPTGSDQKDILDRFVLTKTDIDKKRLIKDKPKPPTDMPKDENQEHWCKFCFGNIFQRSILQKQKEAKRQKVSKEGEGSSRSNIPDEIQGHQPLLSILLNIKQATLQNLMEWHVGWLKVTGFSEHQGKWIYSLLSCLEKPLTPELCDNVRQMVFLCATARAQLDSASHPFLPQLNLIITIVTRYFGQEDLADPR